jgi:DNA-binding HxlR family transcriptional regulator
LETAGLIKQRVVAQTRPCRVEAESLKKASEYIEIFRSLWEERFDKLAEYLEQIQAQDQQHG